MASGASARGASLRVGPFLSVSFQRYPRPASGLVEASPLSFGLLPVAPSREGDLLVPLPDGEALWLGFDPASERRPVLVFVAVESGRGRAVDVRTGAPATRAGQGGGIIVPPQRWIDGVRRPDGRCSAFARRAGGSDATDTRAIVVTAIPRLRLTAARPRPRALVLHSPASAGGNAPPPPAAEGGEWDVARRASVRVRLVDVRTFTRETGEPGPPPLDRGAASGRQRFP